MNRRATSGRRVRRAIVLGPVLLLTILVVGACQRAGELEQFQARWRDLPDAQREDTLRVLAAGEGREAALASFTLGNLFYGRATDLAADAGWTNAEAEALLDSAQARLERAVTLDSTFVEAYVNLGSLHDDRAMALPPDQEHQAERRQQLDEAENLYRQALAIAPDDAKARSNLGSLYQRQGRTADALQEFETVLAEHPDDALAHYNLAILFAEERMYREAIAEWEAAADADPDGDVGERSRENIRIVNQLLQTEVPPDLGEQQAGESP